MKKFIVIVMLLCLLATSLVACTVDSDDDAITLYVPDGAPALSVATLLDDSTVDNGTVSVGILNASEISAMVSSQEADMAILPINTGASLYNGGAEYQLVSVNTFGLLYLMSTNGAVELEDLVGEVVYCIGAGGVPQYVLEYVLASNDIEYVTSDTAVAGAVALIYVTSGSDVIPLLASGSAQYAMLGEPAATKAATLCASNDISLEIAVDLQEQWQTASGSGSYGYPQAGLFVKTSLLESNPELVASVCSRLEGNSQYLIDNVDSVAQLLEDNGSVDLSGTVFTTDLLERCNVGFQYAWDIQGDVYSFLQVFYDVSADSVGGVVPDDDFIAKID